MSNLLDLALSHTARGFHVLPLKPRDKSPIVSGGCHAATTEENQVRAWWTKSPQANVGIGCGASNKAVLDIDHGLNSLEDFHAWRMRNALPDTYTVRTGRRPEFGVQMYFDGAMPDVGEWKLDGCSGQVKSLGGLVCAAGCIHPDSGEVYQVVCDVPFAPTPDKVRQLKTTPKPQVERKPGEKIIEGRNNALVSRVGTFRNEIPGVSEDSTLAFMQQWNLEECADPMSSDEVEDTVRKQFRIYPDAEPVPTAFISSAQPKPVTDWREHYHTREETENAPKPEFLIDGFLQRQAIVGLAGYVGHKKSLIAQNVSYSLCSGEPLFGCFRVLRKPRRVLYLCPEMALIGFANRITRIGLLPYVGESFFYATMSLKDGVVKLPELITEEVEGAVIVLDTAIRFIEGDENSSQHMKELATHAFKLIRSGTEAVIVLAHSNKEMVKSNELTLENAMRGSSELTAFLSSCWATLRQFSNRSQKCGFRELVTIFERFLLLKIVKSPLFRSIGFRGVFMANRTATLIANSGLRRPLDSHSLPWHASFMCFRLPFAPLLRQLPRTCCR